MKSFIAFIAIGIFTISGVLATPLDAEEARGVAVNSTAEFSVDEVDIDLDLGDLADLDSLDARDLDERAVSCEDKIIKAALATTSSWYRWGGGGCNAKVGSPFDCSGKSIS